MNWPYRHIIIVTAAEQSAANAIAAEIDPDDGSGTFRVPLSPSGVSPATHFGCNTLSAQTMADAMYTVDAADPPLLASACWWRMHATDETLIDSNTPQGVPGQRWTWEDALAWLGLQVARSNP